MSAFECHACDNCLIGHLYVIMELHLRLDGRASIMEERSQLNDLYLLNPYTHLMCKIGPTLEEPLDDDVPIPETLAHKDDEIPERDNDEGNNGCDLSEEEAYVDAY